MVAFKPCLSVAFLAASFLCASALKPFIEQIPGCPPPVITPRIPISTWAPNASWGEALFANMDPTAHFGRICDDDQAFARCGASLGAAALAPAKTPDCSRSAGSQFVQAPSTGAGGFCLSGARFLFAGSNTFDLVSKAAAGPAGEAEVESLLDQNVALGVTVVRLWAFGWRQAAAIEPKLGVYAAPGFAALDFVVAQATKRGLKLTLALGTSWDDSFECLRQFTEACGVMDWAVPKISNCSASAAKDYFYAPPSRVAKAACMRQGYKRHMLTVVSHVNALTGIKYADDPTIMSWNILNEPRVHCPAGEVCTFPSTQSMQGEWVTYMAKALKSAAPKQLISLGSEGFYSASTPSRLPFNPDAWAKNEGQDFVLDGRIAEIDYLTLHAWPDNWFDYDWLEHKNAYLPYSKKLTFFKWWIRVHLLDAEDVGKPVVLEEFGKQLIDDTGEYVAVRDQFLAAAYAEVEASAARNGAAAGDNFWFLANNPEIASYGQVIAVPPGHGGPQNRSVDAMVIGDSSTVALVKQHAITMKSIAAGPAAADSTGGGHNHRKLKL